MVPAALTPLSAPFTNIALCLSGGGYRAAAYSLGTLSFLHHIKYNDRPLLDNVVTISTVSGGTIPGLRYALDLSKGGSFTDTYRFLRTLLPEKDIIKEGLIKLNDKKEWEDGLKRRNVINGAAKVYQEQLFENKTLAFLQENSQDNHLKNLIANATEFDHGLAFRFLVSEKNMRFGNGKVYSKQNDNGPKGKLTTEDVAEIRLGDIMAASSCFPGGFEPLAFPDDLIESRKSPLAKRINQARRDKVNELEKKLKETSGEYDKAAVKLEIEQTSDFFNPVTGLMDGGVYDNQGTGSVLTLEENYKEELPFHQLIIVSDVASYFIDDYSFDKQESKGFWSHFSYRSARRLLSSIVLLLLVATAALGFLGHTLAAVVAGTLFLTIGGVSYLLFNRLHTLEDGLPAFARTYLGYFRPLKWGLMRRLIKDRINSVMLMTSEIFLKGIRALHQTILYQDPQWEDRRVYSEIYYLQQGIRKGKIQATPQLNDMANMVRLMPTTLWFTEKENKQRMMDNLIACGQATLCHKLIYYIDQLMNKTPYIAPEDEEAFAEDDELQTGTAHEHLLGDTELSEEEVARLLALKADLEAHWQKFLDNPLWLADHYNSLTGIIP